MIVDHIGNFPELIEQRISGMDFSQSVKAFFAFSFDVLFSS